MIQKTITPILLFVALLVAAALPQPAEAQERSLQAVYNQAVKDYNAGKYEEAKKGFDAVLKAQPRYAPARSYLVKTEAALKAGAEPKGNDLESKIAQIVVPKFSFENATLGTVLTYLTQKSTELSGEKVTANFIYKGPAEDRDNKLITLTLSNVPMTEVIRYVGAQAGVRFTYDKYAIVGTPLEQAKKEDAAAAQAAKDEAAKQASRESLLDEREAREKAASNPFQ